MPVCFTASVGSKAAGTRGSHYISLYSVRSHLKSFSMLHTYTFTHAFLFLDGLPKCQPPAKNKYKENEMISFSAEAKYFGFWLPTISFINSGGIRIPVGDAAKPKKQTVAKRIQKAATREDSVVTCRVDFSGPPPHLGQFVVRTPPLFVFERAFEFVIT